MKKLVLGILGIMIGVAGRTQQIDSIYFNLYTDSLKKGTHNYINVDGKLANGKWLPLSDRDVVLTSSAFQFSGNELIVPGDCPEKFVVLKAALRSNPVVMIERTIWIKQRPDPDLPADPGSIPSRTSGKRKRGF